MKLNLDSLLYFFKKEKEPKKIKENYKKFFSNKDNNNSKLKLNVDRVSKVYENGIKAIDNMSLEINEGEFVVFLGPSGCGKTTLLRMIAGLEKISDGYIKMNNAIINSTTPKDRNIAMVFQNYALYPFMTVFNNIKFGLKNKTQNNNVYEGVQNKIKNCKNVNFDKIQDIKSKISIIQKGSSEDIDDFLNAKRLVKVAKIKKNKFEFQKAKKNLEDIKKQKHLKKNTDKYKEEISNLRKEIKNLYISSKNKNFYKIKELKKEISENKNSNKSFDKLENEIQILKDDSKTEKIERKKKLKELKKERRLIYNTWKSYIPRIIEDTLKLLGINMYSNRKPSELSGGQRQRVALARAISKQTKLFLYDEPLSNLDAKLRGRMRSEIRTLHETMGSTSIYVTHDQIEAMSMADKIVVMNKGYIQQIGSPEDLINNPNNLFVSKFVGNTDVNIFDGKKGSGNIIKIKNIEFNISNSKSLNVVNWEKINNFKVVIRPESIITDKQIIPHMKYNKFTGEVKSTEFLGNDILVVLVVKGLGEIRALFSSSIKIKRGEKVSFAIDPNRILIFENKYGYNILKDLDKYNKIAKDTWIKGRNERNKNTLILYKQKNKISLFKKILYFFMQFFSDFAKEKIQISKKTPKGEDSFIA